MTLQDTIRRIEAVAKAQPAVRTIIQNDVYRLSEMPDVRYGVFAWTQEMHSEALDDYGPLFRFVLFYVDRLTEDGGNQVEVQSTGVDVLRNVIRGIAAELEVTDWTYQTFNQRFADMCAGAFARVAVRVPASNCVETF